MLALAHVAQLGSGEVRVQVQDPSAHLGRAEGDVEEPTVVAAQDSHAVALAHAPRAQPAGHRVGARVELGERQRASLVDQARPVAVADARR